MIYAIWFIVWPVAIVVLSFILLRLPMTPPKSAVDYICVGVLVIVGGLAWPLALVIGILSAPAYLIGRALTLYAHRNGAWLD